MKRVITCLSLLVIFFVCTELVLRYTVVITHWQVIPAEFLKLEVQLRSDGSWAYRDSVGKLYNVRDGLRVTTDTPKRYSSRVLLFGNSTMVGVFVSDYGTSASHLQRRLNSSGYKMKVENYAVAGMGVTQEFLRLKTVTLNKGDIVVFSDSLAEEANSLNCINGDGEIKLTILYLACDASNSLLRPKVAGIISDYKNTLYKVEAYCHTYNVTFIHLLQPRPWIDWGFYAAYGAYPIVISREYFMDDKHLSAQGELIEANVLFDAITEF